MHFIFLTLGYHPDLAGGAYRYVTEVAERLAQRGSRVEVIYPNPENKLPAEESRGGVQLHRYPGAEGFFALNWRRENARARARLGELLNAGIGDVLPVLCHAYFAPCLSVCTQRKVYLFTGPWGEEYRFTQRARPGSVLQRGFREIIARRLHYTERGALRSVDQILTISRYYMAQMNAWHGADLPPMKMISGGVNTEWFCPQADRQATRKKLGLIPGQFLFVALRRLDPRMGLLGLIDGFAPVAGEFHQAELWIAGKGPQREELQARINQLGLSDRARLLGFVAEEELPQLLNAADCTVMPSLDLEGFGLATVESLACGTPVLGSHAGATPEILLGLEPWLLFEAGSPAALTAKLKEALINPEWLPSRKCCRDYVLTHFTWERTVNSFEESFQELYPIHCER